MAIFAKFSNPLFNAPPRGFPLEFYNGGMGSKTRMIPHQIVKKCDDMSILLDTVPTCAEFAGPENNGPNRRTGNAGPGK